MKARSFHRLFPPADSSMASELVDTAQAILTASDTVISTRYRDEDRAWRKEDLEWRMVEREFMCACY